MTFIRQMLLSIATYSRYTFYQFIYALRIEPMTLALLIVWSTVRTTGIQTTFFYLPFQKPTVPYMIYNFPLNCQHTQNLPKNLCTQFIVGLLSTIYTLLANKRHFSMILKTSPFRLWCKCLLQNCFYKEKWFRFICFFSSS